DAARREIACELGVALDAAGATARAMETLEAAAAAANVGDPRSDLRARIELAYLRLLEDPKSPAQALLDVAASVIPTLETLGDYRALGRTWLLVGFVHGGILGRHAAWEEAAARALVYYRKAGWPASTCLGQIAAALYYGPTR